MKKYFLPNNSFFVFMQVISFLFTIYTLLYLNSDITMWLLSLFGYFVITCLGISVTFHRLLTHRSYKLYKPLEYIFSFFGNLGCTGSSIGWVFVHRMHHKYADKIGDPHSPVIDGPIGAFKGDYSSEFDRWIVKDVISNRIHRTMHKYYIPLILLVPLLLFLLDPLYMIHLFWIPVFLNSFMSRMSNWVDHEPKFGTRPNSYNKDQSHNVWWWAWLTFGEGWHYNHHSDPKNYAIGRNWYQFDLGKNIIQLLFFCRLAHK